MQTLILQVDQYIICLFYYFTIMYVYRYRTRYTHTIQRIITPPHLYL